MRQDYFVYNNNRYPSGTIIIIKKYDIYAHMLCNIKAKFLYCDMERNEYFVEIYGKEYKYGEQYFKDIFVCVYNQDIKATNIIKQTENKHTFSDELNIDGLLIAWIWYVFIMVVAFIFYDRIAIWIIASIIFFNYRNRKLKEAGYK